MIDASVLSDFEDIAPVANFVLLLALVAIQVWRGRQLRRLGDLNNELELLTRQVTQEGELRDLIAELRGEVKPKPTGRAYEPLENWNDD